MSRRKRVIDRMWDEWIYRSCDFLRTYSPLRNTEIHYTIEYECYDDREKYFKSVYFVLFFLLINPSKPYTKEYKCSIDDDRLTTECYDVSVLWSDESSGREEERGVESEECRYHGCIVSSLLILPSFFRRKK